MDKLMLENFSVSEVMNYLDKEILASIPLYLKPIDTIWQPAELLPQSHDEEFFESIK